MAELNSGGTSGGSGKPKELSMELRLLLAFILMGVVLFVTPYFYKTVVPPAKKAVPAAATTVPPAPGAPAPAAETHVPVVSESAAAETAAPPVAAQKEEIHTIDT